VTDTLLPQTDLTTDTESTGSTPVIIADGLDFGSGDLRVFSGLDFAIPTNSLAVITGSGGTGKSIMLAAIVGRFAGFDGRLEVAGFDAASQSRKIRKITAAARIGSFVDLEPQHSIADALAERAAIEGLRRATAEDAYQRLSAALGLDLHRHQLIGDLDGYERTALTVALALLRPAKVVVLDDVHRDLNSTDQRRILAALVELAAETLTTIVVSSAETSTIPYDAVRIALPTPGTARTTSSR
jgi:ABC-2 type transport system ATP-binding protein